MLTVPDASLFDAEPAPPADLDPGDPCLVTFTSGTTGEPNGIVHGQRYLPGQHLQSEHWLGAQPGDLVWCTAASGWSKSARNAFIAPWIRGATALLHDARFDPQERLEILARENVNVLCMAPTEYRVIAKRAEIKPVPSLRGLVAAGEALNPEVLKAFKETTGLEIRDGYGQTETGQLTGMPIGQPVRPGSMGRPLPGVNLIVDDGELVLQDPTTDPTFFVGYLSRPDLAAPRQKPWHTGDRVHQDDDGYLYFVGRADDVIISAGYRIGPFEVESALVSHRGRRRGGRRGRPGRGARRGRPGGRGPAGRVRAECRTRHRTPGPRQARDGPVQVPADRRVRLGPAEDTQRQGPPRRAPKSVTPTRRRGRPSFRPPHGQGSGRRTCMSPPWRC